MSAKKSQLVISNEGVIKTIYDESLADLFEDGQVEIRRASHVEPTPAGWMADMSPFGVQITLGPFRLRSEALEAEIKFLELVLYGEGRDA